MIRRGTDRMWLKPPEDSGAALYEPNLAAVAKPATAFFSFRHCEGLASEE